MRSSASARTSSLSWADLLGARGGRRRAGWAARWASCPPRERFLTYNQKPCSEGYHRLRLGVESGAVPDARHPGGRAAGARRRASRAALAAREAAVRGRLVAARRLSRARANARALDPPPARAKVDVASCPGSSSSRRSATRTATPASGSSPPLTSGWCRRPRPGAARGHRLAPGRAAAAARLRPRGDRPRRAANACGPSCPTRTSASRSRPSSFTMSELPRHLLGRARLPVDPTNLRRVLERRGAARADRRAPRARPGRRPPAAVYRFGSRDLEVTDPFAVLRPPRVVA